MSVPIRCLVLSAVFALGAEAGEPAPELAALLRDPDMAEISGMAASRRHPDILWVHNDSDGPAELFALDREGRRVATVLLDGVWNRDWEDIAAFEREGKAFLAVADTGDNGGLRRELEIAVVAEPDLRDQRLTVDWVVRFRWPDGPRDTEALAIDPHDGQAYLVSKKRVPPELWRLSIDPPETNEVRTATRVGQLAGIRQPSPEDLRRSPVFGRYRAQITAFDISLDGRLAAVLNYRSAHVYLRQGNESWAEAFSRAPVEVPFPWLAQAEALAIAADGASLWITTERLPAPLVSVPLPPR